MAEKNINIDLNHNGNEIKNVSFEKLAADPTGFEGRVYLNTVSGKVRRYALGLWSDINTNKIACCPFGAKSDDIGKFLIANGKSTDKDGGTSPKTRQPISFDGTLTKLAYKTKDGDTTTQMKIHVNGVVEETVVLGSINANSAGVETIDVDVVAGDYIEVEYDANQQPNECTMYFLQDLL